LPVQDLFSYLAEGYRLVDRGLAKHLPGPPALIADVGGDAGQQAIPLSCRGYEVTIIVPSPKLEWEVGQRDPYRSLAPLIHLVRRKWPIQV
jgi:hypothetical protein